MSATPSQMSVLVVFGWVRVLANIIKSRMGVTFYVHPVQNTEELWLI